MMMKKREASNFSFQNMQKLYYLDITHVKRNRSEIKQAFFSRKHFVSLFSTQCKRSRRGDVEIENPHSQIVWTLLQKRNLTWKVNIFKKKQIHPHGNCFLLSFWYHTIWNEKSREITAYKPDGGGNSDSIFSLNFDHRHSLLFFPPPTFSLCLFFHFFAFVFLSEMIH